MDQESNQMEQHPVQCRNGCGFYSNAGTDGLCSVCYKDMIKKKQQPPTNMPASLAPTRNTNSMATLSIDESNSNSMSSGNSNNSNSSSSQSSSVETASPTVIIPQAEKAENNANVRLEKIIDNNSEPASTTNSSASSDVDSPASSQKGDESGKKKKNRCLSCKKKVGLTGFECRCGGLFCSIHRYSDKHDCNFDYKELGAEEIRKSNPVVVANKVQKI